MAGNDIAGPPDHVERGEGPEGESPASGKGRRGGATRADVPFAPAFTTTTGMPTRPAFVVAAAGAGMPPLVALRHD